MKKKGKSARAKPIADGAEKFSAWLGKQVGADFGRLGNDFRLRSESLRHRD